MASQNVSQSACRRMRLCYLPGSGCTYFLQQGGEQQSIGNAAAYYVVYAAFAL